MTEPATGQTAAPWLPSVAAESRALAAISGPLIAAYLAEMGMMITDMVIVGRLGSIELAAVGLGADWFYVLLVTGMGIVSMVAVFVAHARGAAEEASIGNVVRQGMLIGVILSLPLMLFCWFLAPLLSLSGQDPAVVDAIDRYMRPLSFGILPALLFTVLRNFTTAMERPFLIFPITLTALFVNLGLNYVLVYGKLGVPALGVAGAGLATTIVNLLMLAALGLQTALQRDLREHRVLSLRTRIDKPVMRDLVVLGMPVAGAQLLAGGMFTVAAVMVGTISAAVLAAQQILYAVVYTGFSVAAGLGDAVRVRVAYCLGRKSPQAALRSATICFFGSLASLVFVSALLWLWPGSIVAVFLDTGSALNQRVLELAVGLAFAAGVFQIFCGLQIVAANALRGVKDTAAPMWYSALGYWVIGLGAGSILCFALSYGAAGLWWGLNLGVFISSTILLARFWRKLRSARAEVEPAPVPLPS